MTNPKNIYKRAQYLSYCTGCPNSIPKGEMYMERKITLPHNTVVSHKYCRRCCVATGEWIHELEMGEPIRPLVFP